MSAAAQPGLGDEALAKLAKRVKRLRLALCILALVVVVSVGGLSFLFWRKAKTIGAAQKDLQFDQFVSDYNNSTDFVQPEVSTIQFLRRGYSVSFDHVEYTQNGLELSGVVGNPTQLWISSLALKFSARFYPYKMKDKWLKENSSIGPWVIWSDDWNIGSAETSVGALNPGSTAPFKVTIPNVKQTSDEIEIAVSFSGERYQYLGGK